MLNLFAFRATDPRDLKRATDPIGPDNDEHLLTEVRNVDRVIACWGGQGRFLERDRHVSDLLNVSFECLLRNKTGAPHHPLYLKSRIRPKPFLEKEFKEELLRNNTLNAAVRFEREQDFA